MKNQLDLQAFLEMPTREQYYYCKIMRETEWHDRTYFMGILITAIDTNNPEILTFMKQLIKPYNNIKLYMSLITKCSFCDEESTNNYLTDLGKYGENKVYTCLSCKIKVRKSIKNLNK